MIRSGRGRRNGCKPLTRSVNQVPFRTFPSADYGNLEIDDGGVYSSDEELHCFPEKKETTNYFPFTFQSRTVHCSVVEITAEYKGCNDIWSTKSRRACDSRSIVGEVLKKVGIEKNQFLYDGIGILFSLRELSMTVSFNVDEISKMFTSHARTRLGSPKTINVKIMVNSSVSSFEQGKVYTSKDHVSKIFLEQVTSLYALQSGAYSQKGSKLTEKSPRGYCGWCTPRGAVHKMCTVIERDNGTQCSVVALTATVSYIVSAISLSDLAKQIFRHYRENWTKNIGEFSNFVRGMDCYAGGNNQCVYKVKVIFLEKPTDNSGDPKKQDRPVAVLSSGQKEHRFALDCVQLTPCQEVDREKVEKCYAIMKVAPPNMKLAENAHHFEKLKLSGNPVLQHFGIKLGSSSIRPSPILTRTEEKLKIQTEVNARSSTKIEHIAKPTRPIDPDAFLVPGEVQSLTFIVLSREKVDVAKTLNSCRDLRGVCKRKGIIMDHVTMQLCQKEGDEILEYLRKSFSDESKSKVTKRLIVVMCDRNESIVITDYVRLLEVKHRCVAHIALYDDAQNIFHNKQHISSAINVMSGGTHNRNEQLTSEARIFFVDTLIIGISVLPIFEPVPNKRTPAVIGIAANTAHQHPCLFLGQTLFTAGDKLDVKPSVLRAAFLRILDRFREKRGFLPERIWIVSDVPFLDIPAMRSDPKYQLEQSAIGEFVAECDTWKYFRASKQPFVLVNEPTDKCYTGILKVEPYYDAHGYDRNVSNDEVKNYIGICNAQIKSTPTRLARRAAQRGAAVYRATRHTSIMWKAGKGVNRGGGKVAMGRGPEGPQKVATNLYPLEFADRLVFRNVVTIEVKSNDRKDIWSNEPRGPTRAQNNRAIVEKAMKASGFGAHMFIYDGAADLFSLKDINTNIFFEHADLLDVLTPDANQAMARFGSTVFVEITTDVSDKFHQKSDEMLSDAPFLTYLELVTSQHALSTNKYLMLGKSMIESAERPRGDCSWCTPRGAVHKSCTVIEDAAGKPQPVVRIDSSVVQIVEPMKLSDLAIQLFPRGIDWRTHTYDLTNFIKNMKAHVCEFNKETGLLEFSARIFTIKGLTFDVIEEEWYTRKYADSKYRNWPAAVFMDGKHERHSALDYIRLMPLQKVNNDQLEQFSRIPSAPPPQERYNQIVGHFTKLGLKGNPVLQHFGIKLGQSPIEKEPVVLGEHVKTPLIMYRENKTVRVNFLKGGWNGSSYEFLEPGRLDVMVFVIIPHRPTDNRDVTKAAEELLRTCEKHGMIVKETVLLSCTDRRRREVLKFVEGVFETYARPDQNNIIVLISEANKYEGIHNHLKLDELGYDLPSQHILTKTMRFTKSMTLDKISQKINLKAGGINYQTLHTDRSMRNFFEETLILGLDVNHPRVFERDGLTPSVVGLAANTLAHPYSFAGDMVFTEAKQEIIDESVLAQFTQRALAQFEKHRGFPKRVWIFRDGVSEGQEAQAQAEATAIENAVKVYMKSRNIVTLPKFTTILVVKRHHTRFFMGKDRQNCPVDTVFSVGVKTYGKRMFYIQAYKPIQGTAKIPAFVILRDDEKLSDTTMVERIVESCNLHQITDAPTSNPTPAVIAHEAAARGASIFRALKEKKPDIGNDWAALSKENNFHSKQILSTRRVH